MKKALMNDLRPGRRIPLFWGLILVVATLAAGADCANAQQAGVPSLRPEAVSITPIPSAGLVRSRGETAALPANPDQALGFSAITQPLEIDDANRYRQIFDLQRKGLFREAELMMG